jgi:hypothetical protein
MNYSINSLISCQIVFQDGSMAYKGCAKGCKGHFCRQVYVSFSHWRARFFPVSSQRGRKTAERFVGIGSLRLHRQYDPKTPYFS